MAIVNRDMDASEQKEVVEARVGSLVVTGVTAPICNISSPATLKGVDVGAHGVSGTPTWTVQVWRFAGGFTAIAAAGALTVQNFGTSGIQSVSLVAAGSSLLSLQAGDQIAVLTGGANSAVLSASVSVVVQKTQDIVTRFGL